MAADDRASPDTSPVDVNDARAAWESLPEQERSALRDREAARLFAIGSEHQRNGRLEEAIPEYTRALALNPNLAEAYNNLGVVLRATGRPEAAVACYRRAIALKPRNASGHSNLGNVLRDLGRFEAAVASHQQAVHLDPNNPDTRHNLGVALRDLGRRDQALDCFERALDSDPNHVPSILDRGRSLLLAGEYAAGFKDLEARFRMRRFQLRGMDTPRWDGAKVKGKTVLVPCEGTLGDIIQFARYLPMIKEQGANVVLEAPAALADLLATVPGVDKLVLQGADLPKFDMHVPLLSLPAVFKTGVKTVPAKVPYMTPPNPGAFQMPPSGNIMKVGIAWADERPPGHATPGPGLRPFLDLAGLAGVTLFGLQTGPAAADLKTQGSEALVIDLARRAGGFSGLAAYIDQLDLVIAVDGAIAHLAGALGKETWVITPASPDWRWGASGETTPWYPKARVLRTERRADWAGLLDQTRRDLRARVRRSNGA
jgi:Flp pilus assembly protein TadD